MALYDQIKATVDEGRQIELFKQILEIDADEFYVMGVSLPASGYGAAKNNLRNVPMRTLSAWRFQNPASTNTSQFFFQ